MDGTLERVLVEHLTRGGREKKLLEPIVSTSSIFEQAAADKVPSVLLSAGSFEMDATVPADATTRLKEEIAGGFVAVAPKKPMLLATRPRLAWWRLDPHSGETTAVTDEGLHAASTEREFVVVETSEGNVAVIEVGEETAERDDDEDDRTDQRQLVPAEPAPSEAGRRARFGAEALRFSRERFSDFRRRRDRSGRRRDGRRLEGRDVSQGESSGRATRTTSPRAS